MIYSLTADLLLALHLLYIIFVILGGLLILKKRWLIRFHLPAVTWAILIEYNNWLCPLTPWEQKLRLAAGQTGYSGSFVEHYLTPLLYPASLDPSTQTFLGTFVLSVNLIIYSWVAYKQRQ